jgi:hypothetical protein
MIAEQAPAVARRSREVVLIYPPEEATVSRNSAPDTGPDPLDLVSILTPDEIDRVLGRRPRDSGPETSLGTADIPSLRAAFDDPSSPLDVAIM